MNNMYISQWGGAILDKKLSFQMSKINRRIRSQNHRFTSPIYTLTTELGLYITE